MSLRSGRLPRGRFVSILVFTLFAASGAFARGLEFRVNGIGMNSAIIPGFGLPTGLDAEIQVPLGLSRFFFTARLAGGYEDRYLLRDVDTGEPLARPALPDAKNWFMFPNANGDVGLAWRFTEKEDSGQGYKSELFALGRFRWELNQTELEALDGAAQLFYDLHGLMAASVIAGVGVDGVYRDEARMRSGYAGELSIEYAPRLFAIAGGTDFVRASIKTEGYLPLLSIGDGADARKRISVYAAWMATGDWVTGQNIPLYALTSFGGRHLRGGIGKSIRGYQAWGYESPLKAAMSAEIRAVGPALFGLPSLRPMIYAFGDCGIFSGLYRAAELSDKGGILFSTGAGFNLGLFDFAYLGLRAGFRFPVQDPLGSIYYTEGSRFFWDVSLKLHF